MRSYAVIGLLLISHVCSAEQGKASWYTGYTRTASIERFSPESMTAAHRTLPFGTLVNVTRTDTGESVVVKINNRGPFIRGRIIDLTPAAFKKLGSLRRGVFPVHLEVIGSAPLIRGRFSRR